MLLLPVRKFVRLVQRRQHILRPSDQSFEQQSLVERRLRVANRRFYLPLPERTQHSDEVSFRFVLVRLRKFLANFVELPGSYKPSRISLRIMLRRTLIFENRQQT